MVSTDKLTVGTLSLTNRVDGNNLRVLHRRTNHLGAGRYITNQTADATAVSLADRAHLATLNRAVDNRQRFLGHETYQTTDLVYTGDHGALHRYILNHYIAVGSTKECTCIEVTLKLSTNGSGGYRDALDREVLHRCACHLREESVCRSVYSGNDILHRVTLTVDIQIILDLIRNSHLIAGHIEIGGELHRLLGLICTLQQRSKLTRLLDHDVTLGIGGGQRIYLAIPSYDVVHLVVEALIDRYVEGRRIGQQRTHDVGAVVTLDGNPRKCGQLLGGLILLVTEGNLYVGRLRRSTSKQVVERSPSILVTGRDGERCGVLHGGSPVEGHLGHRTYGSTRHLGRTEREVELRVGRSLHLRSIKLITSLHSLVYIVQTNVQTSKRTLQHNTLREVVALHHVTTLYPYKGIALLVVTLHVVRIVDREDLRRPIYRVYVVVGSRSPEDDVVALTGHEAYGKGGLAVYEGRITEDHLRLGLVLQVARYINRIVKVRGGGTIRYLSLGTTHDTRRHRRTKSHVGVTIRRDIGIRRIITARSSKSHNSRCYK